jgi:hypothetical protein
MKTLVIIATHHGSYLTIDSAKRNSSHDKMIVFVPESQVQKYNDMYEKNANNPEFVVFKDYNKQLSEYANQDVLVVKDWDMNNCVASVQESLVAVGASGKVFVVGAGCLILQDPFQDSLLESLEKNRIVIGKTRVYADNKRLNMYHMIGLPRDDSRYDSSVFALNLDLINRIYNNDGELITDANINNQLGNLDRLYNMKSDPLIGSAISARETLMHNIRSSKSFVVNFWMSSIAKYDNITADETFGYPLDYYLDYAEAVKPYIPESTFERIRQNGEATKYWVKEIRSILA